MSPYPSTIHEKGYQGLESIIWLGLGFGLNLVLQLKVCKLIMTNNNNIDEPKRL